MLIFFISDMIIWIYIFSKLMIGERLLKSWHIYDYMVIIMKIITLTFLFGWLKFKFVLIFNASDCGEMVDIV